MSAPPLSDAVTIRKATLQDCGPILKLVNELALKQILLPRSPASVIEEIRDFYVADLDGEMIGCGALHIVWTDMAEVRSIAVEPAHHRLGIGRRLIDVMVEEALQLGLPKLFAFTYAREFFESVGFHVVPHGQLPHKVFNDCLHCPKFMACDEIAMERILREPDSDADSRSFGLPVSSIPIPQQRRRTS